MGSCDTSEAGVATGGAIEVRLLWSGACEKGAANEVTYAARLEGAGWLEVLELEEYAAARSYGEGGRFDQRGGDPRLGERITFHADCFGVCHGS